MIRRADILALALLQTVVTFTTVTRGTQSEVGEPRQVVVRNADEWQTLWKGHGPQRAPLDDFSRAIVVGVFLGSRPTAGYDVAITAVTSQDGKTVVEYRESRPVPGRMVAQVLTSPFHLVSIPATQVDVAFRKIDPSP